MEKEKPGINPSSQRMIVTLGRKTLTKGHYYGYL
jgi:hypothetical protein